MALRSTFRASSVFEFPAVGEGSVTWPVQFPVENDAPGYAWSLRHALAMSLVFAWLGTVPGSFLKVEAHPPELAPIIDDREETTKAFVNLVVYAAIFVGAFQLAELSLANQGPGIVRCLIVFGVWLPYFLAFTVSLVLPARSAVLSLLFLFVHLRRFRRHYAVVTSGGLLDPANRELFRRTGKVNCQVTPATRREALIDAIKSWLTYNRNEEHLPGLIRSPVGTKFFRTTEACMAVFLLGNALAFLMASAFHPFERILYDTFHRAPYQVGALVLALLLLIAPLVVLLYAAALFAGSMSLLPTALGLKRSAYSPDRWESFLDSLEFSEDVTS